MSNSEKKRNERERAKSQPQQQSQSGLDRAQADDITMGDEAQKQRDKMQRQENAEGSRR